LAMSAEGRIVATRVPQGIRRIEDLGMRHGGRLHNYAESIIGHRWVTPFRLQGNDPQFVEYPVHGLRDSWALNKWTSSTGCVRVGNRSLPTRARGHSTSGSSIPAARRISMPLGCAYWSARPLLAALGSSGATSIISSRRS